MPALAGQHQVSNAAAVLALLEAVGISDVLEQHIVDAALGSVRLDGRIQHIDNKMHWIVDVAHNPAAAEVLGEVLGQPGAAGKTLAILGMLDDKDVEGVVSHLAPHVDQWIAVTADSHRAIDADELARRVANETGAACLASDSVEAAIARAEETAGVDDRVLLTGSFYLVGPALNQLYSRRDKRS